MRSFLVWMILGKFWCVVPPVSWMIAVILVGWVWESFWKSFSGHSSLTYNSFSEVRIPFSFVFGIFSCYFDSGCGPHQPCFPLFVAGWGIVDPVSITRGSLGVWKADSRSEKEAIRWELCLGLYSNVDPDGHFDFSVVLNLTRHLGVSLVVDFGVLVFLWELIWETVLYSDKNLKFKLTKTRPSKKWGHVRTARWQLMWEIGGKFWVFAIGGKLWVFALQISFWSVMVF